MASDLSLEKNLQTDFKASRKALTEIEQALVSSHSYQEPLAELKTLGESIRTNHQDLLARLNARGERLGELGANAVTRHAAVLQRYEQSISRYLIQLNALEDQVTLSEVLQIKEILKDILPKRKLRIHGSIPYRHLNLPARPPYTLRKSFLPTRAGSRTLPAQTWIQVLRRRYRLRSRSLPSRSTGTRWRCMNG